MAAEPSVAEISWKCAIMTPQHTKAALAVKALPLLVIILLLILLLKLLTSPPQSSLSL
jgi:hypothetical protein